MSVYLKNIGCPDNFTSDWKKLHITKWILLCAGMAMAASGYYIGSSLIIFDEGHQMWILCALFWGSAGICVVAYSIALINLKQELNVHTSLKYEETLNVVRDSKFCNEGNTICTQRDKQISDLLSKQFLKRKPFSWLLNKDDTFKEKYIGCNGDVKGMYGSYETMCKSQTLHTSNGIDRKVSNELLKFLNYKKQSDIFSQLAKSFNAATNETFTDESQKISSSLVESSFTKFSKWEDQTSQLQHEIGFKGIRNSIHLVSEQQPEKRSYKDIFHTLHKDIETNNSFQLLHSFSKSELFEDPYFCKILCEDEMMKFEVESLSTEQFKRSETEIFAFEFASLATIFLIYDLRSNIQQSRDNFLKAGDTEIANDDVKDLDRQFWLKIPMKRSNSKLNKKRCDPIKTHEAVSKNEPDIYHKEKLLSSLASTISGNESALLETDSKVREPEIALNALPFMDKLPTILIEDLFNSEALAESEMNSDSWYMLYKQASPYQESSADGNNMKTLSRRMHCKNTNRNSV